MNIFQRMAVAGHVALRAFRAAPAVYTSVDPITGDRPTLTTSQEDFYKKSVGIYRCINLRADAVARPPLRVYRRGEEKALDEHPLQLLLNKPNPFMTHGQLMKRTEKALGTWGNAFWGIEKGKDGKPAELWPMRPDCIEIVAHKTNYISHFNYNVNGGVTRWEINELLHYQYDNPFNEFWGLTPLEATRLSAEMGIDAITSNRYFFKNYAMPAIGLVTKEPVTETMANEIIVRWNNALTGATKQHKALVLGAVDPRPLTVNPKDADWLNGMKWALSDSARTYGVPEPLIGEDKAVYRNISEAEAAFWRETMIPEVLMFAEVINEFLVPLYNDPALFVAFDTSVIEALQEDANAIADRHIKYIEHGVKTPNDVLTELHMPTYKDGGKHYILANLMEVGKPVVAQPLPLPEETPEDETEDADAETTEEQPDDEPKELAFRSLHEATPDEYNGVKKVFADFFDAEKPVIAEMYAKQFRSAPYDWSSWELKLKALIAEELKKSFVNGVDASKKVTKVDLSFDLVDKIAVDQANRYAARLLGLRGGKYSVTEETRKGINQLITTAIQEGWSVPKIQDAILADPLFTPYRAEMIARTETQRAYNAGNVTGYRESGIVDRKEWLGGADCCDECSGNTNQGVIGIETDFASGDDVPPAHPNCRCRVLPVLKESK